MIKYLAAPCLIEVAFPCPPPPPTHGRTVPSLLLKYRRGLDVVAGFEDGGDKKEEAAVEGTASRLF